MKKSFFVCSVLLVLSACAGGEIFNHEYREQATYLVVFSKKKCPNNEYVLAYQNPDTEQGWKMNMRVKQVGASL